MPRELPYRLGLTMFVVVLAFHVLLLLGLLFGDPPDPPMPVATEGEVDVWLSRDGSVVVVLPDGRKVRGKAHLGE